MTSERIWRKAAAACGNAALGALIGALLAAFGNVIGSSSPGMLTTIVLAAALGGWVEGFTGVVCGMICGTMMVSFGNVIGGSTSGVVSIITVCAMFAGWLSWTIASKTNNDGERESLLKRIPKAAVIQAFAIANYDRSHPSLF